MTSSKSTNQDVRGGNAPDSSRSCFLLEAHKVVPANAEYLSIRIKGSAVPIHKAEDVLVWVCKKMMLYKPPQFQSVMRLRQTNWLKPHRGGMVQLYRIAHNCFVNLDGSGTTPLLRVAKILEWLAWPRADASLTYRESALEDAVPTVASLPAPVEKVAAKTASKKRLTETELLKLFKELIDTPIRLLVKR